MPAAPDFKPTLTEEERAYARALLLALEPFRNARHAIPLSYVITFLQVAAEKGLSVSDYAAEVGISPTVMTRNLLDVGDRNRHKEAGLGWITQERDRFDLRRNTARVTPSGRTVVRKMMSCTQNIGSIGRPMMAYAAVHLVGSI